MIKKTTLLVLLCAVALGAAVYYFDWKRGENEKPAGAPKPAYSIQASDVTSLTLAHPARPGDVPIRFEKHDGAWQIVQPIETGADQSTIDGIVDQIAGAEFSQTEPGTPDRLKVYGLDPPQASVELHLASGAKHTLLVGGKDFEGNSAYCIVDGGTSVSLLPNLLATSTAKTLDDLRDRNILHIDSAQVASFSLKNSSGELAVAKHNDQWKFTKPSDAFASADAVNAMLAAVATSKMTSVESEKPENLARYGLASPAITFVSTDTKGPQSTLLVGKKDGDAYFARDASRPMVFRISADVYTKLTQKFADLRDKSVVHSTPDDVQQIELRNAGGSVSVSRKKDSPGDWVFDAPDDQKGKSAAGWKILDALTGLKADDIVDHPPASLAAQLASPAITAILTDKDGKAVTVRISKAAGDFVYAQASDGPSVYKLKKQVLDDLNLKPGDLGT